MDSRRSEYGGVTSGKLRRQSAGLRIDPGDHETGNAGPLRSSDHIFQVIPEAVMAEMTVGIEKSYVLQIRSSLPGPVEIALTGTPTSFSMKVT